MVCSMGVTAEQVIAIAEAQVGYLEKAMKYKNDLAVLKDKTAGAGSDNVTIFGYEMHQIYPKVMDYPAAWCDCFCDWVFMKTAGEATAKSMIGGDFDDYTVNSAQLYKNAGAWYTTPQVGDQIFFKNSQRIYHTGLVYAVDSNYVYTIEGNTSSASGVVANGGCVAKKKYARNSTSIAGYGRPKYDKSTSTPVQTEVQTPSETLNKTEKWKGEVIATSLNIRKGAGTEFATLTSYPSLKKGQEVSVCDTSKSSDGATWYYIKISGSNGDKYGFAHSSYIKAKGNAAILTPDSPSLSGTYKVKASGLNLRSRAGVISPSTVVTVLKNGDIVSCNGCFQMVGTAKWLSVTFGNYKGYCSSDYLVKC